MSRTKITLIAALFVEVIGGVGATGFYYYSQYQKTRNLLKDPAAAAREEIDSLKKKVARHIQLPDAEVPTIATVSDKSKLDGQAFFANSETGDKVLIFTETGKAILYRPGIDKIIEVAPVNLQPEVAGTQSATVQVQTATLTILNSTSTSGLASVAERKIKAQSKAFEVQDKANAKTDDYSKTLVVVLKPEVSELGSKLAEYMRADFTDKLPVGEDRPETDLILIVGSDFQP